MPLRSVVLCTLAVVGSLFAVAPPLAAQIESGKITAVATSVFDFPKPVPSCLAFCLEIVGVRQELECGVELVPPVDGCDLPWIDTHRPTGALPGQEDLCIPKEPEIAGHRLVEDVDRVRRTIRQSKDCTSEIHDVELEQLDPLGNATRACPDPGIWSESNFTMESIRFVRCT